MRSHQNLLLIQRLNRFIHSEGFEENSKTFDEKDWIFVNTLFGLLELDKLRRFCNNRVEKSIEKLNIHRLRNIAAQLAIPYYTHFNKELLILKIIEAKDKLCSQN